MSDLVVISFDDEYKAEEVRLALARMQVEHLVDLEDAAVVVKNDEGEIKLNQAVNMTAEGAARGSMCGLLIGTIFLNPLIGMAVGAAGGALGGSLTDVGVDDDFMRELAETMKPGSSALFVLVKKATPDKVLAELSKFEGKVIQTSLSNEDEAKLQAALSEQATAEVA